MPLRENKLKTMLRSGGVALGCTLQGSLDHDVIYNLAAAGADFCMIDQEHTALDLETTVNLVLHSHAANMTPLVRIPDLQYPYITRLLDNGAQTLLVPHLREPAEVHRLIELAKYTPEGRRGMAMVMNAGTNYEVVTDFKSAAAWANDNLCLGLNIETPEAVDKLDEMLVPGIDFVLVGYQDLAQGYGIIGDHSHELISSAWAKARQMCAERGIAYMGVPSSPDQFQAEIDAGTQVLLYSGVMGYVRSSMTAARARLNEIGVAG